MPCNETIRDGMELFSQYMFVPDLKNIKKIQTKKTVYQIRKELMTSKY